MASTGRSAKSPERLMSWGYCRILGGTCGIAPVTSEIYKFYLRLINERRTVGC